MELLYDLEKTADKENLEDKDFALIIEGEKREHRKLATIDPESTQKSIRYFVNNMKDLPSEYIKTAGPNLKEACIKYNLDVPSELEGFDIGNENRVEATSLKEKVASEDFGLVVNGDPKFPLRDKDEIVKALKQYRNVKDKLTDEQRAKLAKNICAKADEYGIETTTDLDVNPNVVQEMKFRVNRLPEKEKEAYIKLAKKLDRGEVQVKEAMAVMERLDEENNMKRRCMTPKRVLTHQPTPEKEKTAGIQDNLDYIARDEDLKMDVGEALEEKFSEDLVESLLENPRAIFDSLPDPHKDIIESIVRQEMR